MPISLLRNVRTLLGLGTILVLALPAQAQFSATRLNLVDRPFVGEQLALSPDGKYLAYTEISLGRHTLMVADLDRKVTRAIPLSLAQGDDRKFRRLAVLRWVGSTRLVLQEIGGEIVAIDPDGANPIRLWQPGDDGIVNDYRRLSLGAIGEPPRVIPHLPPEPDMLWLESSARLGFDRLANLYKVNVRDGSMSLALRPAYYDVSQIALYGPGDRLFPPSEDPEEPFPQANPESSSTGVMIYDRQGWPRLLFETTPTKNYRQYTYTEAGKPPAWPNIHTVPLDRFLGQRNYFEMALARPPGEFDVRASNYFGERSYPLGFDYNPDIVYIASNKGRDTWGVFALNLKTKERTEMAPGIAGYDLAPNDPEEAANVLVFDDAAQRLVGIRYTGLRPRTFWLERELGELQASLDLLMPRHAVEIVSWDDSRRRFLLRISSEEDPGAIFLYDKPANSLEIFASRAPWLAGIALQPSASIAFDTPSGVRLTGYLTLPSNARTDPPPLLIYCTPGLWDRAEPGFNREAEMLASMGLVVLRLNYRGSAGFGRKHFAAIEEGIDTVPAEDFIAAVNWIASRRPIDRRRVIVMGEGFGGYLALRAVKNHPDIFRAAIGINAPTNLTSWSLVRPMTATTAFGEPLFDSPAGSTAAAATATATDPAAADAAAGEPPAVELTPPADTQTTYDFKSVVRSSFIYRAKSGKVEQTEAARKAATGKPLLLISNIHSTETTPVASLLGQLGFGLTGMSVDRLSIQGDFVNGSFATRSRVFQAIDEFLNENLYQFDVQAGELKEVRDEAPAR